MLIKNIISKNLRLSNLGRELIFRYKSLTNNLPSPDMNFPQLVSIEIVSACNLSCIHCPPHMPEYKDKVRKFGIMKMNQIESLMDEIDNQGARSIALHKDGEPLLHPQIVEILKRVKLNIDHKVYLTTNAHLLTQKIGKAILENKIDIVNFSIGAANEYFYNKVRGKNFQKVVENVVRFIELRNQSEWKPKVIVQIINLAEFEEMDREIKEFNDFWSQYDVEIQVWDELTWGIPKTQSAKINRYPCYSLWEALFINSDGKVSVCCMDWQQKLVTGDINKNTIQDIWQGLEQQKLRISHLNKTENKMPVCPACNYWSWQPKLKNYPVNLSKNL